jgi:transcriptional regulator with XRE-family HTH domain
MLFKSKEVDVMVTTPPGWSVVLQNILKTPGERQRLSSILGVTTMTLSRWASGESRPQRPHLIHLMQVLPNQQRQELMEAFEKLFPDIQSWLAEEDSEQIPSSFFAQVLNLRTTTTESLRFWRISELVLKQALSQLDPNTMGMAVKLIQCMPPGPDGKIRSLRERAGKGTPPWTADLEHDVLFLGLESMSGYTTEVRHIVNASDLRKSRSFPSFQDTYELSAAAHPIRFEGRIAGCLLASSTQVDYFTPSRLNLLMTFSDLIALAFDKSDFYAPQQIALRLIPKPKVQRPILATFRQRVTEKFQEAMYQHKQLSNGEIELHVWQDIENELIAIGGDDLDAYDPAYQSYEDL